MSRLGRVSRRADQWSSPHERARSLAAERVDSPLDPAEGTWLDEHLLGCAACGAVAAAYDADRLELRSLRDVPVDPPRDLWARTSAGIEREAVRRGRVPRRAGTSSSRSRIPLGALSGIAVVAILVGATALSGGWLDQPSVAPLGTPEVAVVTPNVAVATVAPVATPIVVAAGSVGWLRATDDGGFDYNTSRVDHVCPPEDQPGCAALDDSSPKRITLDATPRSIIGSPTDDRAVVVGSDGSGSDQVYVMSLPADSNAATTLTPSPTPSDTAAPTATSPESAAPTPSETASSEPGATDASATPATETPSSGTETASPEPTPADTASPEPTPAETPSPTPEATPQATAKAIAIATGVTVVGQSAAFSDDGSWFAFTARPSDGSAGPDIYVWHKGDETASRLTTDGSSVFASWAGDMVVGSRLVLDDAADGVPAAESFIVDPTTGKETGDPIALWRPVVDPTGRFAVGWAGTVGTGDAGTRLTPDAGDLVLTSWQPDADTSATRSKVPGADGEISDFDVRWDGAGEWLAIWAAEPTDPTVGRLSLYRLDRDSGVLERPKSAPTDVPALPGFSIGDGRLAWVTPHGQDAEGSKVQVVAWSGDSVGAVESVPGEDVVVVR